MTNRILASLLLAAAFAAPSRLAAQVPDGSDINKAIPIYFGQIINDIIDSGTQPVQVYSIVLAKGQTINVTAKGGSNWDICLVSSATTSIASLWGSNCKNNLSGTLAYDGFQKAGLSFS